jgi:hypothetical protein
MNTRFALVTMFGLVAACGGVEGFEDDVELETESAGLIGGSAASASQWPSTIYLSTGCTAARVSSRSILTAAHCVMLKGDDTLYPFARYEYWDGQTISFTNSKTLDGSQIWYSATVRGVRIHPAFLAACDPHCHFDVSLNEPHAPDVAIILTEEVLPEQIPAAYISTNVVSAGDQVTIMGYGCERSVWLGGGTRRLKYEVTAARSSDHDDLRQGYIHTWGLEDASTEASLCPGDSGGPVYRGTSYTKIVGVNAFYLFDDRDSGVSSTNLHTRIGSGNPHRVTDWLRNILPSTRFVD